MATFRIYPTLTHPKPGSQESLASYSSGTQSSTMVASSDAPSQTTVNTAATSPTSPRKQVATDATPFASKTAYHPYDRADSAQTGQRLRTPEQQPNASVTSHSFASPRVPTTPGAGHKRSASGEVKYNQTRSPAVPLPSAAPTTWRRGSVQSTTSSVGEAANTLKERLAYAMAKVQHGWEHHNIDQVEHLAATTLSPRNAVTPRSASYRPQHASPRANPLPTRSLVDQFPPHAGPQHGQHQAPYVNHQYVQRPSSSEASMSPPRKRPVALAPAAGFTSPSSSNHRDALQPWSSSQVPTTPKAERRPATIRTQMQTAQAEQEAMDALMLMGSPSNGGHFPRGSQPSSISESPRRSQHQRAPSFTAPRMALQYRSESGDSITSSNSSQYRYAHGGSQSELMRQRADVLDQIEAET